MGAGCQHQFVFHPQVAIEFFQDKIYCLETTRTPVFQNSSGGPTSRVRPPQVIRFCFISPAGVYLATCSSYLFPLPFKLPPLGRPLLFREGEFQRPHRFFLKLKNDLPCFFSPAKQRIPPLGIGRPTGQSGCNHVLPYAHNNPTPPSQSPPFSKNNPPQWSRSRPFSPPLSFSLKSLPSAFFKQELLSLLQTIPNFSYSRPSIRAPSQRGSQKFYRGCNFFLAPEEIFF